MQVRRILPRMGTVGQEMLYEVEIQSRQRIPISAAILRELPISAIPSENVFVHSVEPGEEDRNVFDRLFILYRWKWLTGARMGFTASDSPPISVSSRGVQRVRCH